MQKYRAFSQIVRGQKHIEKGSVCQDYALASDAAPNCSVIVVADGHGGDDYCRSDKGARFITQAAATELMDFVCETSVLKLRGVSERQKLIYGLCEGILKRWREQIEADTFDFPFSESNMEKVDPAIRKEYIEGKYVERAYGTTLIAIIITEKFWLAIQLGDGRCISIRPDGSCEQPIRFDERCNDNVTTSVCDEDALKEFRYFFSEQLPAAVFACTDGVEAAFNDIEGAYGFCQEIAFTYLEKGKTGLNSIIEQKLPVISKEGNGDDVSIAGLLCVERLEPISEVLKIEEKLRKTVVEWENAGNIFRNHERDKHQIELKLDEVRANVSQIAKKIENEKNLYEKMMEQIMVLKHNCEEKEKSLDELEKKLKDEKEKEIELEQDYKKMVEEQQILKEQFDVTAIEVETLMTGADKARKNAEDKKKENGESLFETYDDEDFTQPWAFINR